MYKAVTNQEQQHKDFFYPKETMGTTIMAIKYDGGIIACADSRTSTLIQEPHQEESTQSIELQIKSTTFTNTSSHSEVD